MVVMATSSQPSSHVASDYTKFRRSSAAAATSREAAASEKRAAEALAQTGDLYCHHEPKVLAPAFD
jgi:hypothetical protein